MRMLTVEGNLCSLAIHFNVQTSIRQLQKKKTKVLCMSRSLCKHVGSARVEIDRSVLLHGSKGVEGDERITWMEGWQCLDWWWSMWRWRHRSLDWHHLLYARGRSISCRDWSVSDLIILGGNCLPFSYPSRPLSFTCKYTFQSIDVLNAGGALCGKNNDFHTLSLPNWIRTLAFF